MASKLGPMESGHCSHQRFAASAPSTFTTKRSTASRSGPSSSHWDTSSLSCLYLGLRSHDWRHGIPHGGKYLNPGHASGAPAPRSRTRIQTEEEKLRPTSPRPRRHLPPLLASSFSMLFSFISAPSSTYSLSHLGFFFFL